MASKGKKGGTSPYRGLRYYESNQADFFAGRDVEARDCTKILGSSRVMILHGRSGCGKSSFLRAGVKPLMERADKRSAFAENFEVVRSTEEPLKAFATMLIDVCKELISGSPDAYWKPAQDVSDDALKEFSKAFDTKEKRENLRSKANKTHQLLKKLTALLERSPVFVVDQAEEVFTLVEKKERALAKSDSDLTKAKKDRIELDSLKERSQEFFDFLGRVAETGPTNVRIVVSLRTEYKGQLDDRLSGTDFDTSQIKGYYLEDLDKAGLQAAILRPTLKGDEWQKLQENGYVSQGAEPYKKWEFRFDNDVAEKLAKRLVDSAQVPEGGVLPTLQIACLRLWEQAEQAKGGKGVVRITHSHLKRLGKIDTQIQDFLEQRLEEACYKTRPWIMGESDAAEVWHRILFDKLVEVQADGRAVTGTISKDELINAAIGYFQPEHTKNEEKAINKITTVIDFLRSESVALLNNNSADEKLALGHDSVALSLNKWNVKYNRDDRSMMRMMLGEISETSDYDVKKLFPNGQRPHKTNVIIHRDDHWDRQYAQYAQDSAFAERLGITFCTDDKFDLTIKSGRGRSKDWDDLAEKLRKRERESYKSRTKKKDPVNERVMVAADWNAFPRVSAQSVDYDEDELKELHCKQVQGWTDVLVTDLFTGNALIGPDTDSEDILREARTETLGSSLVDAGPVFKNVIRKAFEHLEKVKGVVKCHDEMALRFVQGAAQLVCGKRSGAFQYVSDPENVSPFEVEDPESHYPLADWFLNGASEADPRPRFFVGTAATRAIALQGGGQLYFGTSELTRVARSMITAAQADKGKSAESVEEDVHKLIQRVIKHTTWQLGIAPAQWNQGRNRALVLRLASIGYYTAEHIRSNADNYVRFIRNRVNEQLSGGEGGVSRGARMNRESIRNATKECYSILKFDEYGTEFYDLDSTTAYSTDHASYDSKSVASEIYNELSSLRQRTIVHYESVSRLISWLRARDAYTQSEKFVRDVTELKDCAWRNFRIFNFYDSARLMSQAAIILQREIEEVDIRGARLADD